MFITAPSHFHALLHSISTSPCHVFPRYPPKIYLSSNMFNLTYSEIYYIVTVLTELIQLVWCINKIFSNREEGSGAVIFIDYRDHRPIYEQVVERFKELILKGALEADSQLPSVRNLAMELSINPNTIQRAYAELERQGYIYSVMGKGNFIAAGDLIFREKQSEIFQRLGELTREAKGIRIPKDKIIAIIEESYGEEENDD